jgi:hypothetical protein
MVIVRQQHRTNMRKVDHPIQNAGNQPLFVFISQNARTFLKTRNPLQHIGAAISRASAAANSN